MIFEGRVSLENNGGFASMRSSGIFPQGAQTLQLSARGDGKRYKITLRTALAARIPYESDFTAEASWRRYRFREEQLIACSRGRMLQAPTLSFADVIEVGVLIGHKHEGAFAIQLRALELFSRQSQKAVGIAAMSRKIGGWQLKRS